MHITHVIQASSATAWIRLVYARCLVSGRGMWIHATMRFIWTHVMHPQPIGPTSCAARLLDPNHALVSTMGRDAQVHRFAGTSE